MFLAFSVHNVDIASSDPSFIPTLLAYTRREAVGERFHRGDCNADDAVNIADAVFTLRYLFASRAAPSCLDAVDANDDGAVDLADVLAVLGHLFVGAGPLPLPFPGCGLDPTADGLGCVGFPPCLARGKPDATERPMTSRGPLEYNARIALGNVRESVGTEGGPGSPDGTNLLTWPVRARGARP